MSSEKLILRGSAASGGAIARGCGIRSKAMEFFEDGVVLSSGCAGLKVMTFALVSNYFSLSIAISQTALYNLQSFRA